VTKCFQDFCFGELVSLSDPSLYAANDDDVTNKFCGALRFFVTGDCPEGDRDPKGYFRCVLGTGDGLSSPLNVEVCTSNAATRCGSAFCSPTFDEHS
jgi:hypothetical protein